MTLTKAVVVAKVKVKAVKVEQWIAEWEEGIEAEGIEIEGTVGGKGEQKSQKKEQQEEAEEKQKK